VSWLLYRAGGFFLNVRRLLPIVGGCVLMPLFFAVSNLDYFSASITSLISDGCCCSQVGVHMGLPYSICTPLAFLIALCGPLRGPCHLFDTFPTICNYFITVLVSFESIVICWEPTIFHL
jgi:hypothetical protein